MCARVPAKSSRSQSALVDRISRERERLARSSACRGLLGRRRRPVLTRRQHWPCDVRPLELEAGAPLVVAPAVDAAAERPRAIPCRNGL